MEDYEEHLKELINLKGKMEVSQYDDGSQYFKGCHVKIQLYLSFVGPESQNRNNEGDHRTFPSLKWLKKQNGFLQWGMNFLSWAVQAEEAQPLARGSKTGGWTGCPPGNLRLQPFPKLMCCLIGWISSIESVWVRCSWNECCTREEDQGGDLEKPHYLRKWRMKNWQRTGNSQN